MKYIFFILVVFLSVDALSSATVGGGEDFCRDAAADQTTQCTDCEVVLNEIGDAQPTNETQLWVWLFKLKTLFYRYLNCFSRCSCNCVVDTFRRAFKRANATFFAISISTY
jgi:hypothetical protein